MQLEDGLAAELKGLGLPFLGAVAEDRACIIVTHDNRIFDLADRILVLEDGRITHDGKDMPEGH